MFAEIFGIRLCFLACSFCSTQAWPILPLEWLSFLPFHPIFKISSPAGIQTLSVAFSSVFSALGSWCQFCCLGKSRIAFWISSLLHLLLALCFPALSGVKYLPGTQIPGSLPWRIWLLGSGLAPGTRWALGDSCHQSGLGNASTFWPGAGALSPERWEGRCPASPPLSSRTCPGCVVQATGDSFLKWAGVQCSQFLCCFSLWAGKEKERGEEKQSLFKTSC